MPGGAASQAAWPEAGAGRTLAATLALGVGWLGLGSGWVTLAAVTLAGATGLGSAALALEAAPTSGARSQAESPSSVAESPSREAESVPRGGRERSRMGEGKGSSVGRAGPSIGRAPRAWPAGAVTPRLGAMLARGREPKAPGTKGVRGALGAVGALAVVSASAACGQAPPPAPRADVVATAATPTPTPSAAPSVAPEPPPPPAPKPVTFLAVGDVMLSRKVAARITQHKDPNYPFARMADVFASVDFTFANLEGPFSKSNAFVDTDNPQISVLNVPLAHFPPLVTHRFSVLNLANNHIMDQGRDAMLLTRELARTNGLRTTGAGANLDEAWEPAFVEVRGVKLAFVGASYCSVNDNGTLRNPYVARIDDEKRLAAALAKARAGADFVVATMHAGNEYEDRPNFVARRFAKLAVAGGADVVFGAHPHVVQTVEREGGKWVFYSLGNFIFDHIPQKHREGLAVKVTLAAHGEKKGKALSYELMPVIVEDRCAPRLATEAEAAPIMVRLGQSQRSLPVEPAEGP